MNNLIVTSKIFDFKIDAKRVIINKQSIPFSLIDFVIITQDCAICAKDILELSSEGIAILFISHDNKKFALTLPQSAKNSELKMAQYRATQKDFGIAKWILHEKFLSHKQSLGAFELAFDVKEALNSLQNATDKESLLGIEGSVARRYFAQYFSLFERKLAKGYRSKNPPADPVNALLSYVYTIFYHQITAGLYMSGFDPSIGYLHEPFRDHYALSSDILELFRADINAFVARLFLDKIFDTSDFSANGGVYLRSEARGKLWQHLAIFLQETQAQLTKIKTVFKALIESSETLF